MAKNLLIVEASKERDTLSKWLDPKLFSVEATRGHFKGDSDDKLDVNLTTLIPAMRNDPEHKKEIERMRKGVDAVRKAGGKVYIQTDPDRE